MDTNIFMNYFEVHSDSPAFVPNLKMYPIPDHILNVMNKFWEENSDQIHNKFKAALEYGFHDQITACEKITHAFMETINDLTMLFYKKDEMFITTGVSTQHIINYVIYQLYNAVQRGVSDQNRRSSLHITAYTYPIEVYYEKRVECVVYRVELDIIDFKNKTRKFKDVVALYDKNFVDTCIRLHHLVHDPEQEVATSSLSCANYDINRLIKRYDY